MTDSKSFGESLLRAFDDCAEAENNGESFEQFQARKKKAEEEIIRDDTAAIKNELANLTAFIRTLKAKAKEIKVELARVKGN